MNNMNVTKNIFFNNNQNNIQKPTLAGGRVVPNNNDGGRVSTDEIRNRMHGGPSTMAPQTNNSSHYDPQMDLRNRMQSMQNLNRNNKM